MFHFLLKKLRFRQLVESLFKGSADQAEENLTNDLSRNLALAGEKLGKSTDIIFRRFTLYLPKEVKAAVIFIDGLVDKTVINEHILRPLMVVGGKGREKTGNTQMEVRGNALGLVETSLLTAGEVKKAVTVSDVVDAALSGDTALLIDGAAEALIINSRGWEKRAIEEPDTEVVVRGPREGFVETMRTNTALLRRRIGHPNLTFDVVRLGRKSKTDITIAYLQGIAEDRLVEEVKRRLKRIDTDAILLSGYLEEFIEDAPFSPFPTIAYSERPDVVASKILEGRVAIIIEGSPVVLTVPTLFIESFQNPDDYGFRPYFSSLIRWIRYLAFFLSILSPALYVALATFHQELIPTPLLISMAAATEGTPFPAVVELIVMGIVFEILREAGIRLPRPIGQAISIVGALVIGEAAVSAGLIGAPTVIVIALTAISSFVSPTQVGVSALLRLGLTILAGALGLFGIMIGLLTVLVHLTTLRSFGAPYLAPVAPQLLPDLKDVAVRVPLWAMFTRPRSISRQDPVRQEFRLRPGPPEETGEKSSGRKRQRKAPKR